jgi:hypothetical protein
LYSLDAFSLCASSIFCSNSFSSIVIYLEALTRVCLCIKLSGIFDVCDFGISIKYQEALVNLIFKFDIQVLVDKSF